MVQHRDLRPTLNQVRAVGETFLPSLQPLDQPLTPDRNPLPAYRVSRQVVQLIRIVIQVEKLFGAGRWYPYVLLMTIRQGLHSPRVSLRGERTMSKKKATPTKTRPCDEVQRLAKKYGVTWPVPRGGLVCTECNEQETCEDFKAFCLALGVEQACRDIEKEAKAAGVTGEQLREHFAALTDSTAHE